MNTGELSVNYGPENPAFCVCHMCLGIGHLITPSLSFGHYFYIKYNLKCPEYGGYSTWEHLVVVGGQNIVNRRVFLLRKEESDFERPGFVAIPLVSPGIRVCPIFNFVFFMGFVRLITVFFTFHWHKGHFTLQHTVVGIEVKVPFQLIHEVVMIEVNVPHSAYPSGLG